MPLRPLPPFELMFRLYQTTPGEPFLEISKLTHEWQSDHDHEYQRRAPVPGRSDDRNARADKYFTPVERPALLRPGTGALQRKITRRKGGPGYGSRTASNPTLL